VSPHGKWAAQIIYQPYIPPTIVVYRFPSVLGVPRHYFCLETLEPRARFRWQNDETLLFIGILKSAAESKVTNPVLFHFDPNTQPIIQNTSAKAYYNAQNIPTSACRIICDDVYRLTLTNESVVVAHSRNRLSFHPSVRPRDMLLLELASILTHMPSALLSLISQYVDRLGEISPREYAVKKACITTRSFFFQIPNNTDQHIRVMNRARQLPLIGRLFTCQTSREKATQRMEEQIAFDEFLRTAIHEKPDDQTHAEFIHAALRSRNLTREDCLQKTREMIDKLIQLDQLVVDRRFKYR